MTFEFDGAPGQVSVGTLTLEERDGKTYVTALSRFDSPERDGCPERGIAGPMSTAGPPGPAVASYGVAARTPRPMGQLTPVE